MSEQDRFSEAVGRGELRAMHRPPPIAQKTRYATAPERSARAAAGSVAGIPAERITLLLWVRGVLPGPGEDRACGRADRPAPCARLPGGWGSWHGAGTPAP